MTASLATALFCLRIRHSRRDVSLKRFRNKNSCCFAERIPISNFLLYYRDVSFLGEKKTGFAGRKKWVGDKSPCGSFKRYYCTYVEQNPIASESKKSSLWVHLRLYMYFLSTLSIPISFLAAEHVRCVRRHQPVPHLAQRQHSQQRGRRLLRQLVPHLGGDAQNISFVTSVKFFQAWMPDSQLNAICWRVANQSQKLAWRPYELFSDWNMKYLVFCLNKNVFVFWND